ncbi:MLO-like protein 4 isoform X2 [Jatropha curcas]|uniref:MLO-like protein 4 isoform X2 n=1 Tax=Jatropha curcas TaxID=180498 RepID=UPI00189468D5|nr:MLO-like protein 4 isoform X2 [Jatropha curcas]
MEEEGKSLAITPTWALASVITFMVSLGFFFQFSLERFGKWLDRTKRKALLSALEKIKDELMLFGLLSLLMGHWVVFVAKICVKSSDMSSRFFPCAIIDEFKLEEHSLDSAASYTNDSTARHDLHTFVRRHGHCPEGHEPFASQESLEQLHRLMFVLGVIHVLYSFIAITLAMIKIYGWNIWEKNAKAMAILSAQDSEQAEFHNRRMTRLATFISHRTSHPWSQHGVLVWLTHDLPLTYDFHNFMLRSMEEEFRDIVGISLPLWIYAICCIFLDFHETYVYFWLSFLPAILVLVIGTKLHRVVVKLAVEIMDTDTGVGTLQYQFNQLNLRDELFWFGKPKLLLWLIQLISFQNAFEMATFLWSLWEVKGTSCFMSNKFFVGIRLTFGVITQFWCSFITFPLYVIVRQMDARFKKSIVSENVRKSLHGWKRRVRAKNLHSAPIRSNPTIASTSRGMPGKQARVSTLQSNSNEISTNEMLPLHFYFQHDINGDGDHDHAIKEDDEDFV